MSNQTHIAVENAWLAEHPNTAYGLEDWRRYENGVWLPISDYQVKREIREAAEQCVTDGQINCTITHGLIDSVFKMACARVWVCNDMWDRDANLLACTNGTIDIRHRHLLPHKPENYLTGGVPYAYDETADAPQWVKFLEDTLPTETVEFLREFAGYAATTLTRHELAVWLYGPAGCGKSTFISGLETMLGGRSGLLGLNEVERSRFGLGQVAGKTLLVSSEQPSAYLTATHVVNAMVSGEPITVERKFKDPVTMRPYAKILWSMNELPRVGDAGNGLFRRVRVVKFAARAEADRDPGVKERIAAEGPGILNWALIGLQRLLSRGGFDVPAAVREATAEFQHGNDTPAVFLAECCTLDKNSATKSSDLYAEYAAWCARNGHKAQSSTSMAREWERLGLQREKRSGANYWSGVYIKSQMP